MTGRVRDSGRRRPARRKEESLTRPPKFRKLLVANRGEIAVRVIRACRELGIGSVAVFSDVDRDALHVLLADEAHPIGGAPAAESYLNIERLVKTAKAAGADAVHPGYGFLAENAAFADACAAAGLTFVGPPPAAIRAMGDKTAARTIARDLGVPMVPGTLTPLTSDAEARETARRIGFPLMIKAAMGGGGKGMRLVHRESELANALQLARSEAQGAFGDSAVYVERYVVDPRHVEIQIMADAHGHVVHLGERECSIQRRHQKLIEECPSPIVTASVRERMGEAACRIAGAAGYVNAGTVEFLVDSDLQFYFLEMNTRLQVEHPVTEMVTGLDLVHAQLRVAAGEPLAFTQADVAWRGAAIECRVNAEDPFTGWLPSPGTITTHRPPGGPGIRLDGGAYAGSTVPRFYDTLISKLIAWGEDRPTALARMRRALAEYVVLGVRTTLPVLARIIDHDDFRAARVSTQFLERVLPDLAKPNRELEPVAVVAAVLAEYERLRQPAATADSAAPEPSAWRLGARPGWRSGRPR